MTRTVYIDIDHTTNLIHWIHRYDTGYTEYDRYDTKLLLNLNS